MILPIESVPIKVTTVDDQLVLIQLDAPNGDNPFYFQAEEVRVRGKYRDRNNNLRRGYTLYTVRWFYTYESHDMDLRYFLTAKELELAAPPNFVGEYESHQVRFVNQDVVKNYLGFPGGGLTFESFDTIPSGNVTLEFELKNPLEWDQLLDLKWIQEDIPEESDEPVTPTGLSVGAYQEPEHYTDFSEFSTGAIPDGWESVDGNGSWTVEEKAGATGGQALRFTGHAGDNPEILWSDLPVMENMIVEGRAQSSAFGSNTRMGYLARAQKGKFTTYYCEARDTIFRFYKVLDDDNVTFTLFQEESSSNSVDTWYNFKIEANGTTIRYKIWEDGTSEPGSWIHEVTDVSIVHGKAGLRSRLDASGDTMWFDWVKVTNTDA